MEYVLAPLYQLSPYPSTANTDVTTRDYDDVYRGSLAARERGFKYAWSNCCSQLATREYSMCKLPCAIDEIVITMVLCFLLKWVCCWYIEAMTYRKTPEIPGKSRGLYFSKALFEELTFGEAYLPRETCVSKSIGLALYLKVNLPFLLCFTLYLRKIFQVQAPGGLDFEGLIFGILRYLLINSFLEGFQLTEGRLPFSPP